MAESRWGQIPWTRIAAEGLAIIASILIAFDIDASWERRGQGQDEQAILAGLSDEFLAIGDTLEAWTERTRVKRDALALGLQVLESGPEEWTVQQLDSVLFALLNVADWDPRGGALQAVIASGRLELVSNPDLRRELAGWGGMVDDLIDNQHLMQSFVLGEVVPRLSEAGIRLGRGWALGHSRWPASLEDSVGAMTNYRRLFASPHLEGFLATKYDFTQFSVSDFERGVAAARSIQEMIEAERD